MADAVPVGCQPGGISLDESNSKYQLTDLARGGVAGEEVETEWWDLCTRGDCDCSLLVDRSVSD